MIQTQAQKILAVVQPAAIVDNGSFTVIDIDTNGYDYCDIIAQIGATDIAMVALKLQESDDDATYTDVPGGNFATDGSGLPGAGDDNKLFCWHVNLSGPRKRYLRIVPTAGDGTAGTYMSAFAILSRAKEHPSTAAGRGFAQELFV